MPIFWSISILSIFSSNRALPKNTGKQWKKQERSGSSFIKLRLTFLFNPFQYSVACHIENGHSVCIANKMTGFYMKCNTGLKWNKFPVTNDLLTMWQTELLWCNGSRTHNHFICKQALNHLAKLTNWLSDKVRIEHHVRKNTRLI